MAATAELVQILAERARNSPHTVAYEFLDSANAIQELSHWELYERARGLAGTILRRQEKPRDPVVIVYPPGLDYIVALYACFLAGAPAVPAYPPDPGRIGASIGRLSRILHDLGAPVLVAGDGAAAEIGRYGALGHRVITEQSAAAESDHSSAWPEATSADIALIQYTSGSSATPRGVLVRHCNLEHNMRAIVRCLRADRGTRAVMWLPPYHDMGLIGGILTPLFAGFPVRLMAPFDFLKRPLEWLSQISEFGATASAAPDFAYDLCVRRQAGNGRLDGLDLSRWSVAFNGAEPVRARTMRAFANAFGPAGFDQGAFFPCYGLAEATLLVSGGHWNGECGDGTARISSGTPLPDQTIIVVDAATGRCVADGVEGEIWVSGPSVTDGYWGGTGSAALYAERDGQRFLRTGDVGYLADGSLVVTGRMKDVLVHLGTNYHAADVEQAALADQAGLRPVAAAFMVDGEHGGDIVVVVEARPQTTARELATGVRRRVLAASGLVVSTVVVGPPGTIPRTANGKVQRPLCRLRYTAGEYDTLVAYHKVFTSQRGAR